MRLTLTLTFALAACGGSSASPTVTDERPFGMENPPPIEREAAMTAAERFGADGKSIEDVADVLIETCEGAETIGGAIGTAGVWTQPMRDAMQIACPEHYDYIISVTDADN